MLAVVCVPATVDDERTLLNQQSMPFLLLQVINISCADVIASFTAVKELHGDPASSHEQGALVSVARYALICKNH